MASIAVAINDLLKSLLVPARDEIAVDGITSRVTVGPDEGALLSNEVLETGEQLVGVPVDLIEEVRDVDPALGAVDLAISSVGGERHVVLVVPEAGSRVVARWEVKVHAHGGGISVAVVEGEADTRALIGRVTNTSHRTVGAFGPAGRVEVAARAGDLRGLDGALGWVEVLAASTWRDGPLVGVSTENLKTEGESLEIVIGGLEEVVDVHVKEVDLLKVTIHGVLEEEGWHPVGTHISLGFRGGATTIDKVLTSRVETEPARAHDGVKMPRGDTGVDDRVSTAGSEGTSSIMAKDGKGSLVLGGSNGGDQSRQHGGEKHFCV